MTHPPDNTTPPACDTGPAGDVDVVAGTPPVPITVWRTPTDDTTPIGNRLAARLLATYSRVGDLVYDTTNSPVLRQAAAGADRRYRTAGSRDDRLVPTAGLAILAWPPHGPDPDPETLLRRIRRRLRLGGILAAIIAGDADTTGLVDVATNAGLSYLQHIVAVHAHTDGDQLHPTTGGDSPVAPAAHLRVHTDVMVFQHLPATPPAEAVTGGRADA